MKKVMKIKWLMFVLTSILSVSFAAAQTTAPAAPAASSMSVPINTVLCTIAVVLLLIIVVLAMTVNSAVDLYKKRKADASSIAKNVSLLIGFLLLSSMTFAQDAAAAAPAADNSSAHVAKIYFYSFIILIVVEIFAILFLLKTLRFLTGIEQLKAQRIAAGQESSLWEKMNKMKPIEEEASLDTGHSYDGIRELDNITPPWFTAAFLGTILFAIVYLYQNHISHSMPTQEEEFEVEMRQAKALQDSLLKLQGNNIDESNVKMLGDAEIASGQKLYMSNCSACHGDKGQGGVGPNLTDDYWLHGGKINDVFKSIKYGIVEKGMKSWKDDFSPNQIAQLASYIKTLKGTNPPGAKEKQGVLYDESADASAAGADAATTDSTQTK